MIRAAGFNSNRMVKGRLQASLYYARQNRLERIADSEPDPEPEPEDGQATEETEE